MDDICLNLIGKSKLYIIDYAKEHNLVVKFSYTRGHKDASILTEEYAVRVNYDNGELEAVLSYFKTAI